MSEEVKQKLTNIFRRIFENPDLTISRENTALDIPEWDSFNHVNLIIEVETVFDIKFALGEIQNLKDVGTLEDIITQKLT